MKDKNALLFIFGEIAPELKDEIMNLIHNNSNRIRYFGHLSQNEYIKVMMASDLAFFPGAQSALWQEAIGCGLPLVVGTAKGIEYLNRGGNMVCVKRSDLNDAINTLNDLIMTDRIQTMKQIAESSAREFFSYDRISKQMIEDDKNGR